MDVASYERDIAPIIARFDNDQCLELVFPNRYLKDAFFSKYINDLKREISENCPQFHNLSMRLVLEDEPEEVQAPPRQEEHSESSDPILSSLNPSFTFEKWVGRCNELGKAAAMQVADSPGDTFNPFVIYGDVGRGKTHLMQAVGNHIKAKLPDQDVAYVHSEQFVSEMIRAVQKNEMEVFKERYRHCVLLLDDIQFLLKSAFLKELFHTINCLLDSGLQIVATSDRFPRDLEGLESRLKSRFCCGLTVGIDPPELETRVAILLSKARFAGVNLPEDVAFFIADRIQSNVRELEGALKRLIANASFLSQPISLDFAKESLKDMIDVRDQQIGVVEIQRALAHYYKITIADMTGNSRKRTLARPRQLGMYFAKKHSNVSLSQISRDFGNRDHTTVLHACRHIEKLLSEDMVLKADYDNLLRILNN